jgi:hypothetical protein
MITQVKMLHGPYPVADLLGQISRSNDGSKLSVKFTGQIHPSNRWSNSLVKLLVEFTDQICRSNSWIKFLGQIASRVTPSVTGVTPDVTSNARDQTQAILGPPLASLGQRMGAPTDGLKMA